MTTVADAIRTKAGGSSPLSFPDGFVTAVEGITGGGGGGDDFWMGILSTAMNAPITIGVDDWGTITSIRPGFFTNQEVDSLEIPNTITRYGNNAFEGINSQSEGYYTGANISFPNGVSSSPVFGDDLFKDAYLNGWPAGLTIPNTTLPGKFFNGTRFYGDLIIPDGISTLSTYSVNIQFTGSGSADRKVVVPASVVYIQDYYALGGKTSSTKITIQMLGSTPPTVTSTSALHNLKSIIVPAGSLQAYQEATNWAQFADIMVEASA